MSNDTYKLNGTFMFPTRTRFTDAAILTRALPQNQARDNEARASINATFGGP
jgi:hypothetical protein